MSPGGQGRGGGGGRGRDRGRDRGEGRDRGPDRERGQRPDHRPERREQREHPQRQPEPPRQQPEKQPLPRQSEPLREKQAREREKRPRDRAQKVAAEIDVGSTQNKPELLETIPITTQPGAVRSVLLSFGPDSKTDSPLPDLAPGDRLEVFAELELTTDAADANHPGRIGNPYSYAPDVEATLLLAADAGVTQAGPQAIELAPARRQSISQQRHHGVVTFNNGAATIPAGGLPWGGEACINLVVSASNAAAKDGDVLLVGQNEKEPVVVQDMAGIRVVRYRPASAKAPAPLRQTSCLCSAVPVSKQRTVVLSQEVAGLAAGERLLIKARLTSDAAGLPAPVRISTRLFFGDSPAQTEPGGAAQEAMSWKGNVSKITDFNCLPTEGPMASEKFGVATVRRAPAGSLYVNLVAVSAAPFGGVDASQSLRIDPSQSVLEVTRLGGA